MGVWEGLGLGDGEAEELGAEILLPLQREHGLGRLHRMGLGAGGLAGLRELSNQRAPIFRVRRPRRCGPQPIMYS